MVVGVGKAAGGGSHLLVRFDCHCINIFHNPARAGARACSLSLDSYAFLLCTYV